MKLTDFISERSISAELASTEKKRVLAELSDLLSIGSRGVRPDEILKALAERERVATTGIGDGLAIPHGKIPGIARVIAAIGISHDGVPFDAIDGADVHIFVALLSPAGGGAGDHLKVLAQLSRLLKDPAFRDEIMAQRSAAGILAAFAAAEERG
jgi:PTS system nitrogen regulatory IIA component